MRALLLGVLVIFASALLAGLGHSSAVQGESITATGLIAHYQQCMDLNEKRDTGKCLRSLAEESYSSSNLEVLESFFSFLSKRENLLWCHEFAHYLGWEHYQELGDMGEALATALNACDSGMFHGTVEEFINQSGFAGDIDGSVVTLAERACEESLLDASQGMKSNCYHGLGHGFMFVTDNELPDALTLCDTASELFRESCYTGVFMENIQAKQVGREGALHESKYLDPNDPNFPCSILKPHQQESCFLFQGANNLSKTGGDVGEALKLCESIDSQFESICYRGVGVNIPGPHRTTEESATACLPALSIGDAVYEQCIHGALSFLAQLTLGSATEVALFCTLVEKDFGNSCATEGGRVLSAWVKNGEEARALCKQFPFDLQESCLAQE